MTFSKQDPNASPPLTVATPAATPPPRFRDLICPGAVAGRPKTEMSGLVLEPEVSKAAKSNLNLKSLVTADGWTDRQY